MLQQLDSNQAAKESAVREHTAKLSEKDRIIQNNKAELERLEKRTKMYEHKVQDKKKSVNPWIIGGIFLFSQKNVMVLFQIDILQKTTKIYEDDKRSLQNELETRGQRLQRELSDKRRMEQRLHGVVTDTQLKWEKECVSPCSA